MKVTIEYQDKSEAKTALLASDMASVLIELDNHCRSKIKHGGVRSAQEELQDIRDMIGEMVDSLMNE